MNSEPQLLYFRLWWRNIGNAFIDIGSTYALNKICQVHVASGELLEVLEMQRQLYKKMKLKNLVPAPVRGLMRKLVKTGYYDRVTVEVTHSTFEIAEFIDAKYVVFSGMFLSRLIIKVLEPLLHKMSAKGKKIVLLGVGEETYSETEKVFVENFLKEIKPFALISRDKETYDYFCDLAEHSYNGIDLGFFVSDAYPKVKINAPKYIVLCFDSISEPYIESKYMKVRACHALRLHINDKMLKALSRKQNAFLSGSPYDYLTLYANAVETHTDRVHACVASAAYGTPCKLYSKTPRARLFERVGVTSLEKLSLPDKNLLEKEKKAQLKFLKEIIKVDN